MTIQFVNTIVFVKDIDKSKAFYQDVLGVKIKQDCTTVVFFENSLVLHSANSILRTVFKSTVGSGDLTQGNKNILLYFETNELEKSFNHLKDKVEIIHGIEQQEWGQKVFRFFDLDNHIIEYGEPFRVEGLK